uniref:Uncharacterized protein n=1 Tax=Acrobeloides nanus TaxID=290746 RepID=A0A914C028_9BILA
MCDQAKWQSGRKEPARIDEDAVTHRPGRVCVYLNRLVPGLSLPRHFKKRKAKMVIDDGTYTLGRNDSFPLENFRKGTRVWIKHPEHVWISVELLENLSFASKLIKVRAELDDEILEHKIKSESDLPFLCNPDILIGKDDLTSLSYLHEPAVLFNLRHRFEKRNIIYTYCGIVLVAINPYADCSQLYGDEVIMVYQGVGKQVREYDPHIYAISEEAYFDMCEYGKNQSIIVSGESGAGKTVSAKFVMRYLANVASSRSRRSHDSSPGIESRVLASNPIMEAIGNAKTLRNDNSSRFGKFIQINFTEKFTIAGAEMRTYLLEKSRVSNQSLYERNYHIFYQLCAAAKHPLLKSFELEDAMEYHYLNQGQDPIIPGVDDEKDFLEFVKAFELLNLPQDRLIEIFRLLVGILVIGNIQFQASNDIASILPESFTYTKKLCDQLLNLNESALRTWLINREISAGGETVRKPLTQFEAVANRDALAKMMYSCLFNWIVDKVNESLMEGDTKKNKRSHVPRFIGVLDIYGEELNVTAVEFYDNQPCIDLIESRPGIIDYLDEQCKMARGTDQAWLSQMANCPKLKKCEHLQMPKFQDPSFIVRHFAASVSYKIDGFLEKNKDTVNEQLLKVIDNTSFKFLKEVVREVLVSSSSGAKRKKTVAFQFRDSLKELITVLSSTRPHYVRCIKPNDEKESFYFEPKRAIQQLRACGVLETVRISAAGYPSRWPYDDFARRYRVLYPEGKTTWRDRPKEFAKKACEKWLDDGKFALGKTKVFFRTGQVALLEKFRQEVISKAAVVIQKTYRGFVARRRYQQIREAILHIQAYMRAHMAYRRIKFLQMHRAAICIQTAYRRFICQKRFQQIRSSVLAVQCFYRGLLARREFMKVRYEKTATTIQRYFRGYLVRREQIKRIRKIIRVQCCVRRWLAKRRLKELKITKQHEVFKETTSAELEALRSQHEKITSDLNRTIEEKRGLDIFIASESEGRRRAETERDQMREQLLQNVELMTNPEFSRENSIRREPINALNTGKTSSDLNEINLIKEQQTMINELRRRLNQQTRENERLQNVLETKKIMESAERVSSLRTYDAMKLQEIELTISKLKIEIQNFISLSNKGQLRNEDFEKLFERLMEENDELREKNVIYRAMLSQQFERKTASPSNYSPDSGHWSGSNSDDGSSTSPHEFEEELNQERLIREMRKLLDFNSRELEERNQIIIDLESRLYEANQGNDGSMDGSASTSSGQYPLGNMVSENLSLQKKVNRQADELAEVHAQLRGYSGSCDGSNNDVTDSEVVRLESLHKNGTGHAGLLEITNVPEFVRSLVYELKPRLAKNFVPCLPAYLILAGFRYDDRTKDEQRLTGFFSTLHNALKQISSESVDMDLLAFWLINSWRLFNLMRQYSGEAEEEWTAQNTDKQNAHRMQNFNLEPIRCQLQKRVETFYETFMKKTIQPVLEPKIVPSILQHESISDSIFSLQPTNGHPNGVTRQSSKDLQPKSLEDLVEFLSIVHSKLKIFGADPILISQVFRQIVQWTCVLALNKFMFRKDLCTFEKAIQIKHNVMEIQNWLSEKNLREHRDILEPLVQACHLLQSKKDEGNLDILCGEMTSKLKPKQVVAILQHYTPSDSFEEDSIDVAFLVRVQEKLNKRAMDAGIDEKDSLIMRGTYLDPFDTSKFVYSDFMLETLTLPSSLKLKEYSRLI